MNKNLWLMAWYDDTNLLLDLEDPPLPVGCFTRPIKLSPDWPPHSDFALELHEAQKKRCSGSIERVFNKYKIHD